MKKKRVLISVTNKTGLIPFAQALIALDWEIISTGGTAQKLRDAGVPCIEVSEVTGFPEMLGGRLKILHPKVFGGILVERSKPEDLQTIASHDIHLIDMVVVNLYNFEGDPCINQIDVGGPSAIRAAAKNFFDVMVVVDPNDYALVAEKLRSNDMTRMDRQRLAHKAFSTTAKYDKDITNHFQDCCATNTEVALGAH